MVHLVVSKIMYYGMHHSYDATVLMEMHANYCFAFSTADLLARVVVMCTDSGHSTFAANYCRYRTVQVFLYTHFHKQLISINETVCKPSAC